MVGMDAPDNSTLAPYDADATDGAADNVRPARHGWTLLLLCLGLAILSASVLMPAIDASRRLRYEHEKLTADKDQVDRQIAVNDEFLRKMADDPQLVERLAQRQLRVIRQGTAVLSLSSDDDQPMSPFALVDVPPPVRMAPYQPAGGILADWCLDPKRQMVLIAAGLFLVAVGLVCGPTKE
jgi:hypothetical protein